MKKKDYLIIILAILASPTVFKLGVGIAFGMLGGIIIGSIKAKSKANGSEQVEGN